MNYWERHLGDYYRDAWTLTMLEHGAYGLLMDRYYADEAPIQHAARYEAANARTPTEKAAVDKVLAKFFKRDGDVWRKNRCDEEIDKARRKIDAAKENGKKGGRPKNPTQTQEKPSGLSVGSISETQEKALQTPDTRQEQEQKQQGGSPPGDPPPLTLTDPSESGDPPSKADPIPYAAIVAAYNRTMTRLPKAVEINGKRRTLIRSAWHEGKHRQSVEFWIAHFEECEDDPFLNGAGPYAPPHENWRPSFDFLMSAKTITRVYERALQRMERAA